MKSIFTRLWCVLVGHRLEKMVNRNYKEPVEPVKSVDSQLVDLNDDNMVLTFNTFPKDYWLFCYVDVNGDEYYMHPCSRCGVVVNVNTAVNIKE